jgi:hypothetical protein
MDCISKRILKGMALILCCSGCVTEFVPDIREENNILVVEGLITDQSEVYQIKISTSMPVGTTDTIKPLGGCTVTVLNDSGNSYTFQEGETGIYRSPSEMTGRIWDFYKLHITAPRGSIMLNYESEFIQMLPVSPVSLDYEKVIINDQPIDRFDEEGCRIFLNTNAAFTGFMRWDYSETWILRLPFSVPNAKCWVSDRSRNIMIRNNVSSNEEFIREPLLYISNNTDRLKTRYSIEVNQYSINENEYNYWAALKTMTEENGGIYDVIPSSVMGNIHCIEDPHQTVLGYFSVSAKTSQRIFIDNDFAGIVNPYRNCITDTVYGDGYISGIDTTVWILFDKPRAFPNPRTRILTDIRGCYDCTMRGTKVKPSFWIDE